MDSVNRGDNVVAGGSPSATVGEFTPLPDAAFQDAYGPAFVGVGQEGTTSAKNGVWMRRFSRPRGVGEEVWKHSVSEFEALIERYRAVNGTPGVQEVVGTLALGDQVWAVYESVEGVTLRTFLHQSPRPPSLTWTLSFLQQVARALESMAHQDLIHGDLTPDSVYLCPDGKTVVLTGLGLGLLRDKYGSAYAPPEQWEGFEGDCRADVFAAGTLVHEILFGLPAFPGLSPADILARMKVAPPSHIPTTSPVLRDVLETMLAHYPTRRYARLSDSAEDLRLNRTPTGIGSVRQPPDPEKARPTPHTAAENRLTTLILSAEGELFPRMPYLKSATRRRSFAASAPPVSAPVPVEVPAAPAAAPPSAVEPTFRLPRFLRTKNARRSLDPEEPEILIETTTSIPELIRQFRKDRLARIEREKNEPKYERRRKMATGAIILAILLTPAFGAASLRNAYRIGTVTDVRGSAGNGFASDHHTLKAGEQLDSTDPSHSSIHTGSDSTVLVTLHDACLKIAPHSEFSLIEMDYPVGAPPVRRFALRQGSVLVAVNPQRPGAIFDVVCRGVHVAVHGTAFRVSTSGTHGVLVQTAEGVVRVTNSNDGASARASNVPAGQQMLIADTTSGAATSEAPHLSPFVSAESDTLKRLGNLRPDTTGLVATLEGWESSTTIPAVDMVSSLVHLNSLLGKMYLDPKNVASAKIALGEIGKLIYTNSDEGVPATLNLTTLDELSLPPEDRETYLRCFQDNHLLYYHRLPNNGYEVAGYANDTEHTLIIVRNGKTLTKANP